MNVLFVTSGNTVTGEISPFTKAQGESLSKHGIMVSYFPVTGKGVINYLRNAGKLRRKLKQEHVDILHAHYSLSGWVAVLGGRNIPVVLSLMGDDAQGTFTGVGKVEWKSRLLMMLTRLIQPFVEAIISKSAGIEKIVFRKKVSYVIPNGVQLEKFALSTTGYRSELGLDTTKKYILFLGSPTDINKNFKLAKDAVAILNRSDIELINVFRAPQADVVKYLNSVDVFVHCSFAEGSANAIKEAMAMNCPMVITGAGDSRWLVGETEGCFISGYEPEAFAADISKALEFAAERGRTCGRERLLALGLDADTVARKILAVYKNVIGKRGYSG